jgi:hypothetical protein
MYLGQDKTQDLTKLTYKELNRSYFDNENNPQKQILFANAYITKAKNDNKDIAIARANYQIALLYYKSDYKRAIKYLNSVIKYSKDSGDNFSQLQPIAKKQIFSRNN